MVVVQVRRAIGLSFPDLELLRDKHRSTLDGFDGVSSLPCCDTWASPDFLLELKVERTGRRSAFCVPCRSNIAAPPFRAHGDFAPSAVIVDRFVAFQISRGCVAPAAGRVPLLSASEQEWNNITKLQNKFVLFSFSFHCELRPLSRYRSRLWRAPFVRLGLVASADRHFHANKLENNDLSMGIVLHCCHAFWYRCVTSFVLRYHLPRFSLLAFSGILSALLRAFWHLSFCIF